ncbi:hypothetical protein RHMOL_Rhmol06G0270900 [Rhododendron molle]|uniref:Uncharacterized protein n=1 Tax=Rhododendron molle TaxID=49168 RepID=A0ACC0NHI7_RHOML|nr:hypothetical protein RHMOL_Rhmol06G0270900 [Rhododendron molle]
MIKAILQLSNRASLYKGDPSNHPNRGKQHITWPCAGSFAYSSSSAVSARCCRTTNITSLSNAFITFPRSACCHLCQLFASSPHSTCCTISASPSLVIVRRLAQPYQCSPPHPAQSPILAVLPVRSSSISHLSTAALDRLSPPASHQPVIRQPPRSSLR